MLNLWSLRTYHVVLLQWNPRVHTGDLWNGVQQTQGDCLHLLVHQTLHLTLKSPNSELFCLFPFHCSDNIQFKQFDRRSSKIVTNFSETTLILNWLWYALNWKETKILHYDHISKLWLRHGGRYNEGQPKTQCSVNASAWYHTTHLELYSASVKIH